MWSGYEKARSQKELTGVEDVTNGDGTMENDCCGLGNRVPLVDTRCE